MFGFSSFVSPTRKYIAYSQVSESKKPQDDTDEESLAPEPFEHRNVWPWVSLTLNILFICFVGFAIFIKPRLQTNSLTKGFETDLASAREAIEYVPVKFTGSPAVNPDRSLWIPNPGPIQYVGDPSPEVDEAWDVLTADRYFLISSKEAQAAWGNDIEQFWDPVNGGYTAGLDVLHTLHCVNQLRQLLHPEYYNMTMDQKAGLHRDHCLEQIRQYIMCAGDMTPIPTRYYDSIGRNYVDSDVVHTCRSWDKLKDWVEDRYKGPNAVKPRPNSSL